MRPYPLLLSLLACACVSSCLAQSNAPAERPARIERTPAVSPDGTKICFTYQGNLWVVPAEGGVATRLTANDSYDINPRWSPDGNWIAFNSDREGGNQVFIIPAVGGAAKQITFHSAATTVCDWFPDGHALLVTSGRNTRATSIYKLDIDSGRLRTLVTDRTKTILPALSPDGKWIAYTRGELADLIRKGYKGSANYDIYLAPVDGSSAPKRLTDSDKNDMWPVFSSDGKHVYYSSERDGIATLWKQSVDGGHPAKVVNNPPDAVRYTGISRNGSTIAFECDNNLWAVTPSAPGGHALTIYCRTDQRGSSRNHATFNNNGVSNFRLSPDGKKMAFVERGDIFTVSTEKGGEAKRITDNPTRDGEPEWAADGKSLLFSSNRGGNSKIYLVTLATLETKQLTTGSGNDSRPKLSPDGKWVSYLRGPQTAARLVRIDGTDDHEVVPGPNIDSQEWSPDGKWLSYVREDDIRANDVWVVPVDDAGKPGKAQNITDHPGLNISAKWYPDGSHIAFLSNRYRNRDIETINDQGQFSLYSVPLQPTPDKFDSDDDAPAAKDEKKKVEVKFDFDEIERRAKALTTNDESLGGFSVSPDSKTIVFVARNGGQSDIWSVSADGGSLNRLTTSGESPGEIVWAPDSSKIYFIDRQSQVRSMPKAGGPMGVVAFAARMDIERLVDYYAVFDEAWQTMKDTYYDPKFHGANWDAIKTRYRALVPDVAIRRDFDYLITEMLGELNSSHTGFSGPGGGRAALPTGSLGIFADEIYTGNGVKVASVLPRSPATKAESKISAGEYILTVDGADVTAGNSFDQALSDRVGKTVTLLVNSKPSKEGARTVKIKPINDNAVNRLLYEKWLDDKRAITTKVSNGKVGYLHVPDMGDAARDRFERELYSVGQRTDAMVLDFRGNNGGDTHDSLLRMLSRTKHYFQFSPRTEAPFPQPERAVVKPIIVLIDGGSLSDAEVFANGFREYKLGKIVGKPTMGWIIFTSGRQLLDGSFIRTPTIACLTNDGRDMELWGVPPDIDVDYTPADYKAGRDPQLERAVQEVLKDPRIKR